MHRRSKSYQRPMRQCAHLNNTAGRQLMMVSDCIKVRARSIISERGENHKRTDRWSVFMLNQIEGLSSATRSAINPLGCLSNQKMLTNLYFTVMVDYWISLFLPQQSDKVREFFVSMPPLEESEVLSGVKPLLHRVRQARCSWALRVSLH